MNVEVVRYSPEDKHKALWDAIASCSGDKQPTNVNSKASASPISPFTAVKRYLASCYARVRLSGRLHPLREAIVEGVVSSIVQSHNSKGIPEDRISNLVHRELGIDLESTSSLVQVALERLADEKLCRRHNDEAVKKVTWIGETDDSNTLDSAIDLLVKSAFNRAVVQEGLRPMKEVQDALKNFFKELILQRGWDLGASYASNSVPEGVDIQKLLYQSCTFLSHPEIESLSRVCLALLSEPTEEEAKILTALGQASFALELVIQCPRNTLFHSNVLPQTIYLDANVLMPAITYGHPYFDIYMVSKGQYKDISECMLSNVGLTQLINLLIGGDGDVRGLSRLLWSAKASSKTEEVRHYLVMQALREYDEAMAMEMHQVVDKIAEDIVSEANRLGVVTDSDDPNNRRKFLKFIGEFESKFFEAIKEKIELRQRQSDTKK